MRSTERLTPRPWRRSGSWRLAAAVALALPVPARALHAAACTADTLTAGFPRNWVGASVSQIVIYATTVEALPGFAGTAMRAVHSRTQLWVPTREISVVPGREVDSLELQESVRRLRSSGLYSEVTTEGTRCGDSLALAVHTRDRWSTRVDVRYGRVSSRIGMSEVNLLGSGLALSASAENLDGRNSATFGIADPYLVGARVRGALAMRVYDDGRAWSWSVQSRPYSPRDRWRFSLLSEQLRRFRDDGLNATLTDITRRTEAATAAYMFAADPYAAYAIVFGGEHQRANILVQQPGAHLGKPEVNREFTAPLLGVARRSLDVGSVDWLVPGQPRAELPIGLEGEVVVAVGNESNSGTAITHFDGWVGITLQPRASTIITADVWASAYWNRDSVSNGAARASVTVYQRAVRGIWALRVAAERLENPDPDVYALSTEDPVLRALAPTTRLAESAVTTSLERSITLYAREGRWAIDAVPFIQYSERHRSVDVSHDTPTNPQALLLGIGTRHLFNQPTQSTVRFDVAKSVWLGGGVPNRWVFVLSMQPWLANGRVRDGLRDIVR